MRAAVLVIVLVALVVWLLWPSPTTPAGVHPPPGPVSAPMDGGVTAVDAPVPAPPSPAWRPDPGCAVRAWDDVALDPPPASSPLPGVRGADDVDDQLIGPAMAAPSRMGTIRAGECAGAVMYRLFGDVESGEGGCTDGGRFLMDGSIHNACTDVPDGGSTRSARRPVGYIAETTTMVVLLTAMGARVAPGDRSAGRSILVDTSSTLPGLPLANTIPGVEEPAWELSTVAYSAEHARALGILATDCTSPRQGAEGVFERCRERLRLTRKDGVVAVYAPSPMNLALEGYEARPSLLEQEGFSPAPPALADAGPDAAIDDDTGRRALESARAGGFEVSVLERTAAQRLLDRARASARKGMPASGGPLDGDADEQGAPTSNPYACRTTTCRDAYEAFLAMGIDEFMRFTPAIMVTDRFGRRRTYVRTLFEFPL